MSRCVIALATALAIAAGPAAGTQAGTVRAARNYVISMDDDFFAPVVLRIDPGDSVQWRNEGNRRHTATTQPGAPEAFDIPEPNNCPSVVATCQQPGQTAPLQPLVLQERGTYNYYCKLHGRKSVAPDPERNATSQPCLMCAIIVVGEPEPSGGGGGSAKDDEPKDDGGSSSAPPETSGPAAGPSPSPTVSVPATGTPPPATQPGEQPGDSEAAAADGDDDGGGGMRALGTAVAFVLLGLVWRLLWRTWRPR